MGGQVTEDAERLRDGGRRLDVVGCRRSTVTWVWVGGVEEGNGAAQDDRNCGCVVGHGETSEAERRRPRKVGMSSGILIDDVRDGGSKWITFQMPPGLMLKNCPC